MPIGDFHSVRQASQRRCGRHPQGGFSYLLLLFVMALAGVALAEAGTRWQQAAQREREAELVWRARQITQALQAYAAATPAGQAPWPGTLAQLLEDRRQQPARHWLRQAYADPFTGQADWRLLRDADGGIRGLASRGRQVALGRLPAGAELQADAGAPLRVGDWLFTAPLPAPQRTPQAPPDTPTRVAP